MHLKSVKYICKYALKTAKICTENTRNALGNSKTSTTTLKTVKNKSIFTKGSNFFLQNVHAKKSFPDLLNSFEKKKNELKKLKFSI